jgi:thiamine-monophosphate kinase
MTRAPRSIAALGDSDFNRLPPRLRSGLGVVLGPGDDGAILQTTAQRLLLTVDALVEGVHFRRGWLTARQLGRKAFLVNASDIAAMGGAPRWCVVNIAAPPTAAANEIAAISLGLAAAAGANGASLVGGNLSRARQLSVTVALLGDAPRRPLTRHGAHVGDLLYVTGRFGEAALGVRALGASRAARGPAVQRFRMPPTRWRSAVRLARSGVLSAMIDVSDGLVQDLAHLCGASGVGARIELARVPTTAAVRRAGIVLALTGGEDYELLCAVPARHRRRVERLAAKLDTPLTYIGACGPRSAGVQVVDARGRAVRLSSGGHDHFAAGRRQ